MSPTLMSLTMVLALALATVSWPAPADASEPCCNITAIHAKTQTVTARETKTGRTFQFKVADATLLRGLKVGQAVHADFKTMKVSLNPDGVDPCCGILNLHPATTPVR